MPKFHDNEPIGRIRRVAIRVRDTAEPVTRRLPLVQYKSPKLADQYRDYVRRGLKLVDDSPEFQDAANAILGDDGTPGFGVIEFRDQHTPPEQTGGTVFDTFIHGVHDP